MKKLLLLLLFALPVQAQWVTGYYAGWMKGSENGADIPQMDFSTATHWVFFALLPQPNGTFDGTLNGITTDRHAQFVNAVHAAGRKAIIGTGGWNTDFTGVVSPANRSASVAALVKLMTDYGYDGVDIDWEPVASSQAANFTAFLQALRAARPQMILIAAAYGFDQILVNNAQYFDQLNLMTYDMSGPWPGWVSWHNSAITSGGATFPSGGPLPSIDASVNQYIAAGVPASKLGFGIEIYAYVWSGITGPQQTGWGTVSANKPYWTIMRDYRDAGAVLKWDSVGQAAYYSTPSAFVSMDFETTMVVKAQYLRDKGLGGVIVWETGAANVPNQNPKDRILQQIKHAFLGGPALPPLADVEPPPPVEPPVVKKVTRIVYDEALNGQFGFVPWGATILDQKNTEYVANGQYALKIDFMNWGGADWITGPYWGAEEKIYADSLVFDFYSDQSMSLTVGWYSGSLTAPVVANRWSHVAVPLPTTAPITRFYIQNPLSSAVTAWIDNLRFQSADTTYTPPPPPPVAGCDSVAYYNRGFAAGVASVPVLPPVHDTVRVNVPLPYAVHDTVTVPVPYAVHDTLEVFPEPIGWQYINQTDFPAGEVVLPAGFIVTSVVNNTPRTGWVRIRGLRPKY